MSIDSTGPDFKKQKREKEMMRLDLATLRASSLARIRNTTITSERITSNLLAIGTHDGNFHCDEALAISLLKYLPQYEQAIVVRTRM
jgi:hypothetical protein